MSAEITTAFVNQFGATVFHLSQQKGSRLAGAVRNETQKGESQFFDRIGSTAAILKAGRHAATPQIDSAHSRRRVTLADYVWADLVDTADKIRMLIDPTSDYAMAAMWAMGRAKDDVIIEALGGTAYGGVAGATSVVLPSSQKYAANDGSVVSNLNVRTLIAIKGVLDAAEAGDAERYIVCQSSQIQALLGQTQVTSADYNSVKALVAGEINTFMGFNFIRLERLLTQTTALSGSGTTGAVGSGTSLSGFRRCYAFQKMGALLSTGEEMKTRIGERADLNYSMQVYAEMGIGATRMEEVKVVEIICKET